MSLKGLRGFEFFDVTRFLVGKKLVVASCEPWLSNGDKKEDRQLIGSKINCLIQSDQTVYPTAKDGEQITNKYQLLTFKVPKVGLNFPEDTPVVPSGNIIGKVWGDFHNNLSIEAEDIHAVQAKAQASNKSLSI